MPNRFIKETITTSASIDKLSYQAEVLFYRIIVNCDDFGRMDGRPSILLARCFPLRIGRVKESDICSWLGELVVNDFLYLYKNGYEYLQITNWRSHQQTRATKSKYPDPDSEGIELITIDSNGKQLIAGDSKCARTRIRIRDTNTNTIVTDPPVTTEKKKPKAPPNTLLTHYAELFREKYGADSIQTKEMAIMLNTLAQKFSPDDVRDRLKRFFNDDDKFVSAQRHPLGYFVKNFNKYVYVEDRNDPNSLYQRQLRGEA